jgi:L-serine deaminase
MTSSITRAQFVRGGMKGGLALVAGGTVLAATAGSAGAATATGDVAIAKVAATAELLAVDFYTRSIDSGVFGGRRERYLRGARDQEQDHYDALAQIIGPGAPRGLKFRYPAGTFDSRDAAARVGIALENAFIGAYIGAVRALESTDLKVVAAGIGANEQGHLIVFTDILTGLPVGPTSFPHTLELSAGQAVSALSGFIA